MTVEEFENKTNIRIISGIMPILPNPRSKVNISKHFFTDSYAFRFISFVKEKNVQIVKGSFIMIFNPDTLVSNTGVSDVFCREHFRENKSLPFLNPASYKFERFLDSYYSEYDSNMALHFIKL